MKDSLVCVPVKGRRCYGDGSTIRRQYQVCKEIATGVTSNSLKISAASTNRHILYYFHRSTAFTCA